MEKNEALSFVASILAKDAASFVEAAKKDPRLEQLAEEALNRRQKVADALGIGETFIARLQSYL